ncbi:unnamed protein product [Ectocarpus sp. CCAP 1310/34]|nr:unnamed protein product [Ectocarpus sp. CCAP 1310/34]
MQQKVDAGLDQYLAAELIQHSTSPWASPLLVIPKKDGSVRITVNYKRLNALVDLDGQPLPRVDDILDFLYTGKVFSIFDLNSAFHQIESDEDTVPLTAFCTPTQLFEWLRMPQGANASPSWFVKVINRVVHGLERVLAYLDDVICFDEEPLGHVLNLIEFFKRLRQYNLKLSPGKGRVGATHANFLGHTISPAGVSPDGVKVRALTHMPPPTNVTQLRSLLGGLSYYRKFLKNLATKVRPLNSLLKQGVPFKYTPGMVEVVKTLLSELARPPILVFPDWEAIEDNSRPLRLCSDACIDDFGASLEQEELDGSMRPIVYISRATLHAERNWTVVDLEAGGIGPGTVVGVDFFGPLPVTAKRNSYILLFTDGFSRRANMFAVTAAEFTAKGTTHIFVNQYMTKWGCPTTFLPDNGLHFCSKLSMAIYEVMKIKKFTVGGWAWVYNTAAIIRQGVQKDTDQQVLKAKFALSWTGPCKVLAVGPTSADAAPDGRPLARKLLYLDLPSDLSGPAARCRVSVLRYKPCGNPYETDDLQQSLPAELSRYVLHSLGDTCPPFHVTADDVSLPVGRLEVDQISGHELVRGRSGVLPVLYQTQWLGLPTPSWERESDLDQFRRHILLYWSREVCQSKQGRLVHRSIFG